MAGTLIKVKGAQAHRAHYDSLTAACAVKPDALNVATLAASQGERSEKWYGPETHGTSDGTAKLYRKGWSAGADKIAQSRVTVEAPPQSIRRRREQAEQGDSVDMGRVWAGQLDRAWQRTRRAMRVSTRAVTILCPLTILSTESIEQLYPRGAAALKLADALTESGYSVGIVATVAARRIQASGAELCCLHTIDVKRPDDMLDMTTLAAILAHPGFFRTAGFAMIASAARATCTSFGGGDNGNTLTDHAAAEYRAQGDTVLVMSYDVKGEREANSWLARQLEAFKAA